MVIYLVTDYKGKFGSKYTAVPYRSGFDKDLLVALFKSKGIEPVFINPSCTTFEGINYKDSVVLYTSQEDNGLFYKSFLEDFLYALTIEGAKIIPPFSLLKSHENKVFFEMLRTINGKSQLNSIKSRWFGTYEEFCSVAASLTYPIVIKSFQGSMSKKVYLAQTETEALKKARKVSKTWNLYLKYWDFIRSKRHKGYIKESFNRKKFIIQEFIPGLKSDFKVLIYGSKYYVINRLNKPGDFRASGQGNLSYIRTLPEGLLDFAETCFNQYNTPQASLDIAFDGIKYYLLEGQFVYFGTYTIEFSNYYFVREVDQWSCIEKKSVLEEVYVDSILEFLKNGQS